MVTALLVINFLLMIILPIALARKIAGQYRVGWGLFGIGAVTFILSQVAHLPFNWLVLQRFAWIDDSNLVLLSVFLGLSAGSFEGMARYLAFRFWAREARSWRQGLMVGMGHGGIEAILVGVVGLINFTILLGLKEGHFQGILSTVPGDQLYLVDAQINALFGVSAPMALLGIVERTFVLLLHLSASLLIMQVFVRQQLRWLGAGILWHSILDGSLVYVVFIWGVVPAEVVLGMLSVISLGIIFWLRQPEPVETELPPLPDLPSLRQIDVSHESLERSKFT